MASSTKGLQKSKNTTWFGKWKRWDVVYASFVTFVHVLCFFAPSTFSWSAFTAAFTAYILFGLFGINLSYHRNLAHRSFKLPKYLEYLFAYFGFLANQGDPIFWVSTHRHHHKYADTDLDPHTPMDGFWFSHILWIFNQEKMIQKDPISRNLIGVGVLFNGVYIFQSVFASQANAVAVNNSGLLWHRRLGHPSMTVVTSLPGVFVSKDLNKSCALDCQICYMSKQPRNSFPGANTKSAADLSRQRYYRFLRKNIGLNTCMIGVLLYLLGGFPFVVWVMGVTTVWGYHITFVVNSVAHIWGHQAWNTRDTSRNVWYLSLFTFGESWHNNHHAFEFSARHGLEWWQLDPTWYVIKTLEYLGLATDVKIPSGKHKQKMAFVEESK